LTALLLIFALVLVLVHLPIVIIMRLILVIILRLILVLVILAMIATWGLIASFPFSAPFFITLAL
jgi:hypothetical protein